MEQEWRGGGNGRGPLNGNEINGHKRVAMWCYLKHVNYHCNMVNWPRQSSNSGFVNWQISRNSSDNKRHDDQLSKSSENQPTQQQQQQQQQQQWNDDGEEPDEPEEAEEVSSKSASFHLSAFRNCFASIQFVSLLLTRPMLQSLNSWLTIQLVCLHQTFAIGFNHQSPLGLLSTPT